MICPICNQSHTGEVVVQCRWCSENLCAGMLAKQTSKVFPQVYAAMNKARSLHFCDHFCMDKFIKKHGLADLKNLEVSTKTNIAGGFRTRAAQN